MTQGFIDNRTSLVKDDLVRTIREGDRISIAAASFSMYAYRELREQLEHAGAFRFIYTSKTFTEDATPKEQREFYIPRLEREQSLYGTPLEIRLRNEAHAEGHRHGMRQLDPSQEGSFHVVL